jgi:pyruvate dehydrogenase E2 component (dihydrolipoamide acetyltransferase)
MIEFKLPELGENVTAGDVLRVLVKPGDGVTKDQPVLELETDKATIEVPSSVAGTVKDVKVKAGEKVKVGQPILVVDEKGNGAAAEHTEQEAAEHAEHTDKGAAEHTEHTGQEAAEHAEHTEQEAAEHTEHTEHTDKGATERAERTDKGATDRTEHTDSRARGPKPQPAGAAEEGGLSQQATADRLEPSERAERPEPAKRKRGEVVDISRAGRPAAAPQPAPEGPAPAAAPSVRRIARDLGVDIRHVSGSGPSGRITADDVHAFVRQAMSGGGATGAVAVPGAAQPLPDFEKWGEVERKPLSNIRRKTAEHLGHAWNVIPHVTQHDRADITATEALRKEYGPRVERAGGKLTVTAIALKILAGALKSFPQFTASIDQAAGQLVYKKYTHIGIAVDTDRGLLVPVIRDVASKGITELAAELATVSEKARAGKLSLEEMSGGVITITNLGGIGGTSFTPIVNWPEVAILGISRGSYEPVFDGQSFQPRMMLPLSLSYDHRVIDGADAARFLRWVAEAFEQPFVLAL